MYARLIRWAFDRFYHEFAWTYDVVAAAVSGGRWRDWALAALPLARGATLELGCGTGNLQCALAERGVLAFGLDRSAQMLALTRRKAERAGVRVRLARGDARALPFPPATFSTLLATFPSEYIIAPATLAEARRVLRPGGRLAIVLAAQLAGPSLYRRAVELAYRVTLQRPAQAPSAVEPYASRLLDGLRRAGFAARAEWQAAPGALVYVVLADAAEIG